MPRPLEQLLPLLRAPGGGPALVRDRAGLVTADGVTRFPLAGGVPVLIDEARSLFRHADYLDAGAATPLAAGADGRRPAAARWRDRLASGPLGLSSGQHDIKPGPVMAMVAGAFPTGRVLVVGAGDAALPAPPGLDVLYTDVSPGPLVDVIADAHDLPLAHASIHAVFAVSVLEHVLEPARCVAEFVRVLVPGGIVYAVTPFLQSVHLGCYDFTRFTPLGHRMLFRQFDEVASGLSGGAGTALSWTLEGFATALTRRRWPRAALGLAARIAGLVPRWLDRRTMRRAGGWYAAGAHIFVGTKRVMPLDARTLLAGYRGAGSPRPPATPERVAA